MAIPAKKGKTMAKPAAAAKKPAASGKSAPAAKAAPAKKPMPTPAKKSPPAPTKPAAKPTAEKSAKPVVAAAGKAAPAKQVAAKTPLPAKKAPSKPAPPARPAPPPPPADKPVIDKVWLAATRDELVMKRDQLLSAVRSNRDQLAESQKDYADIGDRASGGFEDEIAAGLLSLESAQIEEIDEAIARIDKAEYGLCSDCRRAIPRKRLEILPFAKRCLNCEGQKERQVRPFGADADGDEEEGDSE